MSIKVAPKGNKYFELYDTDNNNQYRIFFRTSKNPNPTFSITLIHEVSPSKSILYRKSFLLEEFNAHVKGFKQYDNIDVIQNDLISNIMNCNIQIKEINNIQKLINILLDNCFQLSFQVFKVHEIIETNNILIKVKQQEKETNNIKNKYGILTNNLQ